MDLPLASRGVVGVRADAARNRRKVLHAAASLFASHGVAAVTMDDVATAAGVGKGTLYRRFGDKAGFAAALLDEQEQHIQAGLLAGPPPLGPDAPPVERLLAVVETYLAYVAEHVDLVAMSQTASPGARLRTGAHRLWRRHCAHLLAAAGAPDPDLRADMLLAALTAEPVAHWLRAERRSVAELIAAVVAVTRSLAAGSR